MNELLENFDFRLKTIERKQELSILIVRCISNLGKECQYSKLLEYHMNKINRYDNETEIILNKKKLHEELYDDWISFNL